MSITYPYYSDEIQRGLTDLIRRALIKLINDAYVTYFAKMEEVVPITDRINAVLNAMVIPCIYALNEKIVIECIPKETGLDIPLKWVAKVMNAQYLEGQEVAIISRDAFINFLIGRREMLKKLTGIK